MANLTLLAGHLAANAPGLLLTALLFAAMALASHVLRFSDVRSQRNVRVQVP